MAKELYSPFASLKDLKMVITSESKPKQREFNSNVHWRGTVIQTNSGDLVISTVPANSISTPVSSSWVSLKTGETLHSTIVFGREVEIREIKIREK